MTCNVQKVNSAMLSDNLLNSPRVYLVQLYLIVRHVRYDWKLFFLVTIHKRCIIVTSISLYYYRGVVCI